MKLSLLLISAGVNTLLSIFQVASIRCDPARIDLFYLYNLEHTHLTADLHIRMNMLAKWQKKSLLPI